MSSDRRKRPLRFDSLEDRRLLAGLTVFVFEDVNASHNWQQESERGLADRVVFLDANVNGQGANGMLDGNEIWELTDSDGFAQFQGLAPSEYFPTLLNENRSPTPPSNVGNLVNSQVVFYPDYQDEANVFEQVVLHRFEDHRFVALGEQVIGINRPPEPGQAQVWMFDEDSELVLDADRLTSLFTDPDGDPIMILISSGPSNGTLQWSSLKGDIYVPRRDFEGRDVLTFQAYDGYSLSLPNTVTLDIKGVNDAPSGLDILAEAFPEDAEAGREIGHVIVFDPDQDAEYFVTVNDPRFLITDGILRLAPNASFNSDEEATVTFEVVATDSSHPSDQISQSVTVEVLAGLRTTANPGPASTTTPPSSVNPGTSAWQNPLNPLDVDHDGQITPRDPLLIINHINRNGAHLLGEPPEGEGGIDFYDVNGDGYVTPLDVLIIINELNRRIRTTTRSNSDESPTPSTPNNVQNLAGEGESALPSVSGALLLTSDPVDRTLRNETDSTQTKILAMQTREHVIQRRASEISIADYSEADNDSIQKRRRRLS